MWHGLQRKIKAVEEERDGIEMRAVHAVVADVGSKQSKEKWHSFFPAVEVFKCLRSEGCGRRGSSPISPMASDLKIRVPMALLLYCVHHC